MTPAVRLCVPMLLCAAHLSWLAQAQSLWTERAASLFYQEAGTTAERLDAVSRAVPAAANSLARMHAGGSVASADALPAAALVQTFGKQTNGRDVHGNTWVHWDQEVWAKPLELYPGQVTCFLPCKPGCTAY